MIVTGTYRDGRVDLDETVDCPNGTPVQVVIETDLPTMMSEDKFPRTAEGVEALAREIEVLEPVELTPRDEAEIAAARAAVKAVTLAAVRRTMGLDR